MAGFVCMAESLYYNQMMYGTRDRVVGGKANQCSPGTEQGVTGVIGPISELHKILSLSLSLSLSPPLPSISLRPSLPAQPHTWVYFPHRGMFQ